MVTQELCYRNLPAKWTVTILDQDVSDLVQGTIKTNKSLDTVNLTQVEVGNAVIQLKNDDNNFSTDRDTNFFTTNRHVYTGYKAPVMIRGGFNNNGTVTDKILFIGQIQNVSWDVKGKIATVTAIDNTATLRESVLDNFGIQRSSKLNPTTASDSVNREYGLPGAPVSDESVYPFVNGNVMKNVGQLDGIEYSDRNFALNSDRSAIEAQIGVAGTIPLVTSIYRAPFRNISVANSVLRILERYNVSKKELDVGGVSNVAPHFASRGRIQYSIEQLGRNPAETAEFKFNGFITDFAFSDASQTFYFLESSFDADVYPRVISYSILDDVYAVEFTAPNHKEWWNIATGDFNTFYIGQTDGRWSNDVPTSGAYNPAQTGAQTSILQWVRGASPPNNAATYNTSGNRRYTPAYFYSYGFNATSAANSIRSNIDYGFRPDSRFGFIYHDNKLYFRFASSTNSGVATMTSTGTIADVFIFPNDGRNNECSHDFAIDSTNDLLYGSHTRKSLTDSIHITYEKDIS